MAVSVAERCLSGIPSVVNPVDGLLFGSVLRGALSLLFARVDVLCTARVALLDTFSAWKPFPCKPNGGDALASAGK